MLTLHEDTYTTEDGLALFTRRWKPESPPKAIVLIVHGYAEHGGRYERFAQRLVEEGYEVACMDHRGHGKSPGTKGRLSPLRDLVRDFDGFVNACARECPDRPLLVYAHSMGGLIGGLWASDAYGTSLALTHASLKSIVLSSGLLSLWMDIPLWMVRMLSWYGRLMPLLPVMPFETEALTQDREIVRAYEADPLVYHGWIRMQTAMSFAEGMTRFRRSREAIRLPLLVCHGTADRLCEVRGSRCAYRDACTADKTYQEYAGGYHELFNEPFRETYFERLIAWLDAHLT